MREGEIWSFTPLALATGSVPRSRSMSVAFRAKSMCSISARGDQKTADYLKINPTARIPTLIDPGGPGGKPLTVTQSWAILMYLCEKTGKFLPPDPVARVRIFQ